MTVWPLIFILLCRTCFAAPGDIGQACTQNSDCTDPNAECSDDDICECKDGFEGTVTCIPEPGKIGGSCKATEPRCDDNDNAKCESNVCTCNAGYTAAPGAATCDIIGGATATSFPSLLLFVAMTSVAVVIAQ